MAWLNSSGRRLLLEPYDTIDPEGVNAMLAETFAQWEQEWLNEGRAEGIAQGKAEGRAEGKAEGKTEGIALSLLGLLKDRFGMLPDSLLGKLASISDSQILLNLLLTASKAASLEIFAESVDKARANEESMA